MALLSFWSPLTPGVAGLRSAPTTTVSPDTANRRAESSSMRRCWKLSGKPAGSTCYHSAQRRRPPQRQSAVVVLVAIDALGVAGLISAPTTTVSPDTPPSSRSGHLRRCWKPSGRPAGSTSRHSAQRRRPRRRRALLSFWLPLTPLALLSSAAPTTTCRPTPPPTSRNCHLRRCWRLSGRPAGSTRRHSAQRRRPRRNQQRCCRSGCR